MADFSVVLRDSLTEVNEALPADLNVERFIQNGIALLNGNKDLQDFARENGVGQIKQGMIRAAILGLDFMNKECYLVRYGNTLNFMADYRGNIKLCKKYSPRKIKDIYAKVVREGDEYQEMIVDGHPSVEFKPLPFNNGKVVGAFAVCLFEDGGMLIDSMSLAELEQTRKASKASSSPAWMKFTNEMYKKTILHRLTKHISLDLENPMQSQYLDEDFQMETDPKILAKRDIEENQNTEVIEGF